MKKIKWTIMTLAILFSVGGATATRLHQDCKYADQYFYNGSAYVPAGKLGIDYMCLNAAEVCTYWVPSGTNTYTPCLVGMYYTGMIQSKWGFKQLKNNRQAQHK